MRLRAAPQPNELHTRQPLDDADSQLCLVCLHLLRWFRCYLDVPDASAITLETTFVDLGVDLLDYMDLLDLMDWLMEAEDTFSVPIDNAQAERIDTVHKYLALLRDRGAERPVHKSLLLEKRGKWCPPYHRDIVTEPPA